MHITMLHLTSYCCYLRLYQMEPSLLQFTSGLQHLNGVSVSPTLLTLLNHLKKFPILSKLLWLALESFGHATAWLSHQKNWNLFSVNVAMAGTGLYQLSRKIRQDYFSDEKEAAASLEG
uniref:Uncharacterized protein n=1 Tax=Arundo donax TaxID=35708 RepID=A0A0A9DQ11_ARUDO